MNKTVKKQQIKCKVTSYAQNDDTEILNLPFCSFIHLAVALSLSYLFIRSFIHPVTFLVQIQPF